MESRAVAGYAKRTRATPWRCPIMIPFKAFTSDVFAADLLRQACWSERVYCPRCRSDLEWSPQGLTATRFATGLPRNRSGCHRIGMGNRRILADRKGEGGRDRRSRCKPAVGWRPDRVHLVASDDPYSSEGTEREDVAERPRSARKRASAGSRL
jgi:hypothetical protein